jgi:hypothetical protein
MVGKKRPDGIVLASWTAKVPAYRPSASLCNLVLEALSQADLPLDLLKVHSPTATSLIFRHSKRQCSPPDKKESLRRVHSSPGGSNPI